jgi:hypothetical protein
VAFRDPITTALEVVQNLENKVTARADKLAELKLRLVRAEHQLAQYRKLPPLWPRVTAAVLGLILGAVVPFIFR